GGGLAIKILVVGGVAGSIIGKGGSVISEIKQEFNIKMHISGNDDLFPGSMERVVYLGGENPEMIKGAARKVVSKIAEGAARRAEKNGESSDPATMEISVTLSLPSGAVGAVIGKGGSHLKAVRDASGCTIRLAQREEAQVYPSERLTSIRGSTPGCQTV
ncbi:unnamed protein product, partial [Heterosigma akashiwo]